MFINQSIIKTLNNLALAIVATAAFSFSGCATMQTAIHDSVCDGRSQEKPAQDTCPHCAGACPHCGGMAMPYDGQRTDAGLWAAGLTDGTAHQYGSSKTQHHDGNIVGASYPVNATPEDQQWAPRVRHLRRVAEENPALVCDAHLRAARAEFDRRLGELETKLVAEQKTNKTLSDSLDSTNAAVAKLRKDVQVWQGEVRRLDELTAAQHESEMALLDRVTNVVNELAYEFERQSQYDLPYGQHQRTPYENHRSY